MIDFHELFEAIFCEAYYGHFRNLALKNRARPLPRGQIFLNKLQDMIEALVEASAKPRIEVVSR